MLKYILLGLVQGLTEFLPVSSSGHLVLLQRILQISEHQLFNIVLLHLATTLAAVVFFWADIIKALKTVRTVFQILIVTFITGLIALSGKDYFTGLFSSVGMVSLSLLITGIILLSTKGFLKYGRGIKDLNFKDALILGLVQGIAVIPGISRSGSTISALLFRKVDQDAAFRFSFLAAIPAIFGAFILEAKELNLNLTQVQPQLIAGFLAAFISGLLSLYILRIILQRAKFFYFGYYCISAAVLSWIFLR
jgi:undecaprenyl-diphosphatase